MRIRIQIQATNSMRIHTDPDPKHSSVHMVLHMLEQPIKILEKANSFFFIIKILDKLTWAPNLEAE
jgi:hypothetical protein